MQRCGGKQDYTNQIALKNGENPVTLSFFDVATSNLGIKACF
jgi:hypothetical protein